MTPPPLTPEQSEAFEAVRSASNIALMSAVLDDREPVSVICAVTQEGDDVTVTPLYLAMTDELFGRLGDPTEV